jgi:transcriptional regulator with XRE-family HTH domain
MTGNKWPRPLSAIVEDLQTWILKEGLTQEQVAELVKRRQSTVSRLLAHKTTRLVRELCAIAGINTHGYPNIADFPKVRDALIEVLDGSRERENAVADLLRAAKNMATAGESRRRRRIIGGE